MEHRRFQLSTASGFGQNAIPNRTRDERLGQNLSRITNKFGQIAMRTEDRLNYHSTIGGISTKEFKFDYITSRSNAIRWLWNVVPIKAALMLWQGRSSNSTSSCANYSAA
jgi:hypothetical protein